PCIIAAGVIRSQGPVTIDEFVEGSVEVWNAGLKRSHWDEDDYHGPSTIHMDGASYHKRITNKAPTNAWRKGDITAWIHGTKLLKM
ncbi:hypothetical protein PF008_g33571, partial [Phytophthora fragariae]